MENNESIRFDLRGVSPMTPERIQAVRCIALRGKRKVRQLIMTGQIDLYRQLGKNDFQNILNSNTFRHLYSIVLSECGFHSDEMPNLNYCSHLEFIDISDNNLLKVPNFQLENLRELHLEGNPIPKIEIDLEKVPKLQILSLGSKATKIISSKVIEQCAKEILIIEVGQEHKQFLIVPLLDPLYTINTDEDLHVIQSMRTASVMASIPGSNSFTSESSPSPFPRRASISSTVELSLSKESSLAADSTFLTPSLEQIQNNDKVINLSKYFKKVKEEMNFGTINNVNLRFEAMEYVLDDVNCQKFLFALTLTGQSDLLQMLGPEKFNQFLKRKELGQLKILNLNECELSQVPDFTSLSSLHELDINKTSIKSLANLKNMSLKILKANETTFEALDFNPDKVPSLYEVSFGSPSCQFIRFSILRKVLKRTLILKLSDRYRKILLGPPPQLLDDMHKLTKYVNYECVNLREFGPSDPEGKQKYLQWLTSSHEVSYEELNLDDEEKFFQQTHFDLSHNFETGQAIKSLKEVHLDKCGLISLPTMTALSQLEVISARNNNIEKVESRCLPSSVKKLKITKNPISCVDIDCTWLTDLSELDFGSKATRYISFPVLERVCNGDLSLNIPEQLKKYLLMPPAFLFYNQVHFTFYIKNIKAYLKAPETFLKHIPKTEAKKKAFQWLRCRSGYQSIKLDLDSQDWLSDYNVDLSNLSLKGIVTLVLSNCKLKTMPLFTDLLDLKHLTISNNNLVKVPEVTNLKKLKTLILKNNNIDSMDRIVSTTLTDINLHGNPIKEIIVQYNSLPLLQYLGVGSKQTQYISLALLEKVREEQLHLDIPDECLKYLVYPSSSFFKNKQKMWTFLDSPFLDLTLIPKEERHYAFEWVMKYNDSKLVSLNLVASSESDEEKNSKLLETFDYFKQNLHQLMHLRINFFNITSVPDLSSLTNLLDINLKCNKISKINCSHLPVSVRKLSIQENPIESLHFDCDHFPSLIKIECGSVHTHYITTPILKRVQNGNLTLSFPEKLKERLYLPPPIVFKDPRRMDRYIDHPEKFLPFVAEAKNKQGALEWLFTSSCWSSSMLDFSSQRWLHDGDVHTGFIDLQNVEILILRDCALARMPEFGHLDAVKHLNLADNEFNTLCFGKVMHSLRTLDVTNNPMEELDFDADTLPCLKVLKFGSPYTKYVSHRVLSVAHRISLDVSDDFRYNLLLPTWDIIANGTDRIVTYMDCPVLRASHIAKHVDRWNALWWQINKGESTFSVINFSHDESFCDQVTEAGLSEIFSNPGLASSVTEINFSNCDLKTLPEWNSMKSLEIANLNCNKLQFVPESSTLRSLYVVDNEMRVLSFQKRSFPNLVDVEAGSSRLRFITFETLKEFSVKISEKYQMYLIMPPRCVWDNTDDLKRYVSQASESVKCLIHVDDSNLKDAVLWLGNDADITFVELDLRNQSELVKHIGPDNLHEFLNGRNLINMDSLNLTQCGIKELVDLEHLMKLTTLCLADNSIADIKSLSHSCLDTLDVTNNPIHTIDLNFEQCPLLKQLRAGSLNTQSVSLNVLQRIADDKLRIHMDSYGDSLLLLPQFIANSKFNQTAVKQYLENGIFDTSWFGECRFDDFNNILSADERKITTFRIRNFSTFTFKKRKWKNINNILKFERKITTFRIPNFSEHCDSDCQSDSILPDLFKSPTLKDIQCLVLTNCNLSGLPALPHLSGLSEIDLSENPIIFSSEETCESLTNISTLTLRNCSLTKIPHYVGLKQLEKLDVGCNKIQQITAEGCFGHLRHLAIDDNPIESLDINRDQFPGLKEIKCGSNELKFLGFELLQIAHGLEKEHDTGITITFVPKFRTCLLLPPFSVIAADGSRDTKVEIQRYLKRPDLYLEKIKDIALRLKGLQWLVKNFPSFQTFSLKRQAGILGNSQELLNHILINQCFKEMECLDLSYCSLQKCPDLSGLSQLKSLYLEGNQIKDMKEISKYQLTELNIVENPIREIRWEQGLSSNLKLLNFGSSETKFISHTLLLNTKIELCVSLEHRDALLCPPYAVLSDHEKLEAYRRNPETILGELHTLQWIDAFEWIVLKSQAQVSTLNLSKKSELFTEERKTRTMTVMSKENLPSLVELNLHACQLKELPILNDLPIQILDLSNNAISDFSSLNLPKLVQLIVSGNPIETVHFNLASYKFLEYLKCGSRQTKFISFDLLKAHIETDFQLEVDEDYKSNLLMPPINILLKKSLTLSDYLDKPHLALQEISDVKDKNKALNWIINEKDKKFHRSFSLSNQADLCKMLGEEGVQRLIHKLTLIIELHLEQCELNYFPDVSCLTSLTRLCLDNNKIREVSITLNLEKLEEIYITDNPIKEVDFNIAYVPSLRALHFGSKCTTHVKLACLKGLVHNNVKLVNYCRSVIQFPPGKYLQGEEENNAQLRELISAPEKALVLLDSTEKQFNLLTWIFGEFEQIQGEEIDVVNLKGYKSLMNYHLTKHVEPILNSPGLKAVKFLTLNNCGLEKCANIISFLSNLTYLDVGNNNLKEWPLIDHDNLRKLILSGNPMGNISDTFGGLRHLSHITLGSKSTNYITTRLLAKMAGKEKENLVIEISTDEGGLYRKCLKLPPYSVLADDNENQVSKYLKRPDQFLTKNHKY